MHEPLAILSIEDSQADFLLLRRHCLRQNIEAIWERVDRMEHLRDRLNERKWDLVLSDYQLPQVDFTEAFSLIRSSQPDVPVILISGHVGEEKAVELIKLGVRDFLLKGNLGRLLPVITNALREAREIKARRAAEKLLADSEERYRVLAVNAPDIIWRFGADGTIRDVSGAFQRILGYSADQLIGGRLKTIVHPEDLQALRDFTKRVREAMEGQSVLTRLRRGDGQYAWLDGVTQAVRNDCGDIVEMISISRDVTERQRLKTELQATTALHQSVTESANDAIVSADASGTIVAWNPAAERLFGYGDADILGRSVDVLIPERYRERHRAGFRKRLADGAPPLHRKTVELSGIRRDGSEFPLELSVASWGTNTGRFFTGILRDITDRKNSEDALRVAAAAFESSQGMVVSDAQRTILRVNKAFTRITGYTEEEAIGSKTNLLKSGRHDQAFYETMWRTIDRTGSWSGEIWNKRRNGEVYPEWLNITAVKGASGRVAHYVGTFNDITQRKEAEDRINELAYYDPLTHLPNRRLLMDRLHQTLAASLRNKQEGALLFVDLDHFKTINDTSGHDMGDLLLQEVAKRLATCTRDADTVARTGGDEFVVVLDGLSEIPEEAAAQAEIVGEKILSVLAEPYPIQGREIRSTPSIGITLFGDQQGSIEELMKQADIAMYQAKSAGRNALRFFDPNLQAAIKARAILEADLRSGVAEGQFTLHYHPQVEGGRVIGAEALIRWQHPERGMVSPAVFIPLAEETGLILPLGRWVLETACSQVAAWARRGDAAGLTVAVNVSAKQFNQSCFVQDVLSLINQTSVDPKRIKLELTESMLAENIEDVIRKMNTLKSHGINFSLDDFGTGYSSLSYLKRLPLDQLKIDQSFVRDVLTDPNDAAIAKTIVALARSLGLAVIAEGVETVEQKDFLSEHGCHAYQGYLFSRPVPLKEFETLLRAGADTP